MNQNSILYFALKRKLLSFKKKAVSTILKRGDRITIYQLPHHLMPLYQVQQPAQVSGVSLRY